MLKKKKHASDAKHKSHREKQFILLMISNGEICKAKSKGWQYNHLAVKKLSVLLIRMTSMNNDDFYSLNCVHSLRKRANLIQVRMYVKIKIFVM